MTKIPYRIDLAGGWLDQPEVSEAYPGPVVVVGVEATRDYGNRCGMATSSRAAANRLWGEKLPNSKLYSGKTSPLDQYRTPLLEKLTDIFGQFAKTLTIHETNFLFLLAFFAGPATIIRQPKFRYRRLAW